MTRHTNDPRERTMPSASLMPSTAAANDTKAPPSALDPQTYLDLYGTWLQSLSKALEARQPLSGDVTQWIRAWGEAVGQVGLLNFNIAGSNDPQAERRIGSRFSYGRQLGRMTELLEPYVRAHEDQFRQDAGAKPVKDFLDMATEIRKLKETSVEDIVAKVSQWRDDPDFGQKLDELMAQLQGLKKPHQASSRRR
jgi:hypothetical protein